MDYLLVRVQSREIKNQYRPMVFIGFHGLLISFYSIAAEDGLSEYSFVRYSCQRIFV
jgi:hypothetical protein